MNTLLFGTLSGLWPLLILLVVGALLLIAFKGALTMPSRPQSAAPLEVKAKRYFFTQAERALYTMLIETLQGTPFTVFSKVRLNDLVEATGEHRQATNNRINRMHVDFLVLSQLDFKPVLVIELDSHSHGSASQAARDAKKDAALHTAGIALLRLHNGVTHQALVNALEPYLEINVWSGARLTGTRDKMTVKN